MKKKSTVADIMTKNVAVIDISESLYKAKKIFNKLKIKHLPVVKNAHLVGIITKTDIMRMSFGEVYGESPDVNEMSFFDMLTTEQVMKSNPTTVGPDDTVINAAEIFVNKGFHSLPVVKEGKLVGIITTTDVIRFLKNEYMRCEC